jgi:hypothetical protein
MEPTDDLADDCVKLLKKLGSNATKVSHLLENKADPVYTAIESGNFLFAHLLRNV